MIMAFTTEELAIMIQYLGKITVVEVNSDEDAELIFKALKKLKLELGMRTKV
jgi:hypothetical protein